MARNWRPCFLFLCLLAGPATALTLEGSVTDDQGRAIPNARAELRAMPNNFAVEHALLHRRLQTPPLAADTAAPGRWSLEAPMAGIYQIHLSAPGYLPVRARMVAAAEDRSLAPAHLRPARPLTVTVTTADGQPAAGVAVWAFSASPGLWQGERAAGWSPALRLAWTDDLGIADLWRLDGERLSLHVLGTPGSPTTLEAADSVSVALESRPQLLMRLVASQATAEPMAGAVIAVDPLSWPIGLTDADGRFSWGAAADVEATFRVFAADGRTWQGNLPLGASSLEPLLDGGILAGRVVSSSGRAIHGALVWPAHDPGRFVLSAPDGSFQLMAPAGAEFTVHASAPGFVSSQLQRQGQLPQQPLAMTLEPAIDVLGVVRSAQGQPISRAKIEARDAAGLRLRLGSDQNGNFRIAGARLGSKVQLRIASPGFTPVELTAEASTRRPLEAVLQPLATAFGRVLDLEERPIAGAWVEISASTTEGGDETRLATQTDQQGRFQLYEPLPGNRLTLVAGAHGHAPLEVQGIRVETQGSKAVDLGTLLLDQEALVVGQVVGPQGAPLEGVGIWTRAAAPAALPALQHARASRDPDAVSDPQGRFVLGQLPPDSAIDLFFDRAGYAAAVRLAVAAPSDQLVTTLKPAVAVRGRVETPAGDGVSGAELSLEGLDASPFRQPAQWAVSDADGYFEIEDVPAGRFHLAASADGWRPSPARPLTVDLGQPPRGIVLVVERGAAIRGLVTSEDGQPVAEAIVSLGTLSTRSDAEGGYQLTGLEAGEQHLLVEHQAFQTASRDLVLTLDDQEEDFVLRPGKRIAGRVVDSDGLPVARARLAMAPSDPSEQRRYQASSQDDGTFSWPGVADGHYQLAVQKPGFTRAQQTIELEESSDSMDDVEIVLRRGTTLSGQLLGLPLEQLADSAVVLSYEDGTERTLAPDFEGRFEARDLRPGGWRLTANAGGGRRQASASLVIQSGDVHRERNLEFHGLHVTARVRVDDESLAGARITLDGVDVTDHRQLRSDDEGRFELEDLTPGRYRLGVRHDQPRVLHHRVLDLFDDRQLLIDLELGAIAGRVFDEATGQPVAGALVTLRELLDTTTSGGMRTAGTDDEGRFRLADIGGGRYDLEIKARGFIAQQKSLELASGGGREDVQISLEATQGLELRVGLASGKTPQMVHVRTTQASGSPMLAESQMATRDGRVHLPSLPPGTHQLWVGATAAAARQLQVTVPGDPVDVVLPDAGRLRVRIPGLQDATQVSHLQLLMADGRPWTQLGIGGEARSTFPVAGGVALIDDVPAGAWTVHVRDSQGGLWQHAIATSGGPEIEVLVE